MQIAFHGKRVEIKEIENTMLKYAGIYASAVIYDSENQQINAYYVSNSVIDVNKLKDFLKTLLPPHMIPTFINRIDKIPVNISGKTNYDKLKKLHNLPSENTDLHGYSPEESKLLKIVMDVVGINQLPDNDYWKVDTKTIGYNSINAD